MSNMLRLIGVSLIVMALRVPLLSAQEEEVTATEETVTATPEETTETKSTETETATEESAAPEQEEETKPEEKAEEPKQETESPKWEEEEGAPATETKEEEKKVGPDEVMGIDTVDLAEPQGNWLYKRVWWERAEAKFEKIREVVNKILEFRTSFFAKRAELDKNVLDPFYIKIGISQGELQEILSELIEKVEKIVAEAKGEQILEKAEADKKSLQDLQERVAQVQVQDEEVEKAILMLLEQISKIRGIEQEAWQDFKGIARVLDDKKARELFYKVDAAWRNIKELQNYIENTFAGRFDLLITKVKEEITRVEQEMNALTDSGIDLKRRLLSVEKGREIEQDDEDEEVQKGIFTRYIIEPIKSLFRGLWSLITWPYRALFGPVQEQEDEEEPEEMPVEQKEPAVPKEEKAVPPEQEKTPEAEQPAAPQAQPETPKQEVPEEQKKESVAPVPTETVTEEITVTETAPEAEPKEAKPAQEEATDSTP